MPGLKRLRQGNPWFFVASSSRPRFRTDSDAAAPGSGGAPPDGVSAALDAEGKGPPRQELYGRSRTRAAGRGSGEDRSMAWTSLDCRTASVTDEYRGSVGAVAANAAPALRRRSARPARSLIGAGSRQPAGARLVPRSATAALGPSLVLVVSRVAKVAPLERPHRRPVDDVPFGREAAAVAGAIPALLGVVPGHQAAEVRAHRAQRPQGPDRIAIDRQLLAPELHHPSRARGQVGQLPRRAWS